MDEPERALLRFQGGSGVGASLHLSVLCLASTPATFAVVRAFLLPSIRFPWWKGSRWKAQQQGFVAKQVRVTTNVTVGRFGGTQSRKCPFGDHGGVQFEIDTTLISNLHCDGSALPGTADTGGAASVVARRKKRTYPELAGSRARLVVLACEMVGWWCPETRLS